MSSYNDKLMLVRRAFGACELSRDKVNVAVRCPNCNDKNDFKKKLVIKIEDGMFHCWVCGIKGRRIDRLFRKFAISHTDNARKLFRCTSNYEESIIKDEEEVKVSIPSGFQLLGRVMNAKDPDIQETIRYVKSRGLTLRDIWYYRLGTCSAGRFRRRVIIPSFSEDGKLNYYSGRTIDADNSRKYMNVAVSKNKIIFNDINIDWQKDLTLVEGPFDLMKCRMNSTCLLGSQLSESSDLFRKIIKNQTSVTLALDQDAIVKSHNIAKCLSEFGIRVRMLNIPSTKDVGDLDADIVSKLYSKSTLWNSNDRLRSMIKSMSTGSLL